MNARFKTFIFGLSLTLLLSFPAHALKDSANLALDKAESMVNDLELIDEVKLEFEKTAESIKAGIMGPFDVLKGMAEGLKNLDPDKMMAAIQAQADLAKDLKNPEKTSENVDKLMIPVYGDGNDSTIAYLQNRKRTEMQQNNIATLYGHAMATRAHIAIARDKEPKKVSLDNARKLVNANRAVATQIAKRYNDILFMESQITEFEATQILTTINRQLSDEEKEAREEEEAKKKEGNQKTEGDAK